MKYIKYIIEGFVEVIGLLPLALILHILSSTPDSPLFKLPSLVNVRPSMIVLIYFIYTIYSVIVIVAITKLFDKSIRSSKALSIKAVGWIIALVVIIFVFNNQLFNNSEAIPEVLIWLIVVCIGSIITYYKNRRRDNGK
jgi:uncharacterized protein YacL